MISASDLDALLLDVQDSVRVTRKRFEIIRTLAAASSVPELEDKAREVALRLVEFKQSLGPLLAPYQSILGHLGLFPFLERAQLSTAELLVTEFHRPLGFEADIVFHRKQAEIYWLLLGGENVVLSAPTSFGKSLIIDAMIATEKFRNVMIVVPTLALIDETRKRLFTRFKGRYTIITQPWEKPGNRNVFVLTQERVLEIEDLSSIDFFVIDEFYKLSPTHDHDDRSNTLNQAFYRLWKGGAQFYFLGPNIQHFIAAGESSFTVHFVHTKFATVVLDIERVRAENEETALLELCNRLTEPTLIYCQSPASASKICDLLVAFLGPAETSHEILAAQNWVADEFHPEWRLVKALGAGIGIHHGKIPRPLQQFQVRMFNESRLRFLVCTSTLIEGVNTAAKNVIIFDNKLARRKMDFFTFNNIKGRSGRMFQHALGKVFIFNEPPASEDTTVDLPVISQAEDTPLQILLQLAAGDLRQVSKDRLRPVMEQSELPLEVLRANHTLDPEVQVVLARQIRENAKVLHGATAWTGTPRYAELLQCCELIWQHFLGDPGKRHGIRSAAQLAYTMLHMGPRPRDIIENKLSSDKWEWTVDEAVEQTLVDFRDWAGYQFPQMLRALDRIQRHVFPKMGLTAGNYAWFAMRLENLFLPPWAAALEEFGIPIQAAARLVDVFEADAEPMEILAALHDRQLQARLHPFERLLLVEALRYV